jgi:hypothetical protein
MDSRGQGQIAPCGDAVVVLGKAAVLINECPCIASGGGLRRRHSRGLPNAGRFRMVYSQVHGLSPGSFRMPGSGAEYPSDPHPSLDPAGRYPTPISRPPPG